MMVSGLKSKYKRFVFPWIVVYVFVKANEIEIPPYFVIFEQDPNIHTTELY